MNELTKHLTPIDNLSQQLSGSDLAENIEKRYYQRVTRITVQISWESMMYIRRFVKTSLSISIYEEAVDQNARITNRAIAELLLELMQKLNKKLAKPKRELNLTMTIPQAWAFSELYSSISAEKLDNYTFSVIQPIIDSFNRALIQ
jgi:hypothetical protein